MSGVSYMQQQVLCIQLQFSALAFLTENCIRQQVNDSHEHSGGEDGLRTRQLRFLNQALRFRTSRDKTKLPRASGTLRDRSNRGLNPGE